MRRSLVVSSLFAFALVATTGCKDSSGPSSPASPSSGSSTASPTPAAPAAPPLTTADIDLWHKLMVAFAKAPKTAEGQKAVRDQHGVTIEQWDALYGRVRAARNALGGFEARAIPIPAHLAADVEIVKANRAKIELGIAGKAE